MTARALLLPVLLFCDTFLNMINCCISHYFTLLFHFQNSFLPVLGVFWFWWVVVLGGFFEGGWWWVWVFLRTTRSNVKSYLQVRSREKWSSPQAVNYSETEKLLITRFFWAGPAPTFTQKGPEAAQYEAHTPIAPARIFPLPHSKDATTAGTNSANRNRINFLWS